MILHHPPRQVDFRYMRCYVIFTCSQPRAQFVMFINYFPVMLLPIWNPQQFSLFSSKYTLTGFTATWCYSSNALYVDPQQGIMKVLTGQTPHGVLINPVTSMRGKTALYNLCPSDEDLLAATTVASTLPSNISVLSMVSMSFSDSCT